MTGLWVGILVRSSSGVGIVISLRRYAAGGALGPTIADADRCGCFCVVGHGVHAGVPLITVLFMANTMLPLFPSQASPWIVSCDTAHRRRLLRLRLYVEVIPRRPPGDPQGQYEWGRCRLGRVRPKMIYFIILPQALRIVIPPGHRQHLHRLVQGHDAGVDVGSSTSSARSNRPASTRTGRRVGNYSGYAFARSSTPSVALECPGIRSPLERRLAASELNDNGNANDETA